MKPHGSRGRGGWDRGTAMQRAQPAPLPNPTLCPWSREAFGDAETPVPESRGEGVGSRTWTGLREPLGTPQGLGILGWPCQTEGWERRKGLKRSWGPGTAAPLTFDDGDVLYLVAGVVVGGLELAHVDPLVAGGEALQVEAHQVLVHGDVGAAPVDVFGDADGAVDDVLPVVLGDAELVGQRVAGFVLVAAVHPQALAQQAGAQVLDHLALGGLEHWDKGWGRGGR